MESPLLHTAIERFIQIHPAKFQAEDFRILDSFVNRFF
jgi:hypothetical protein